MGLLASLCSAKSGCPFQHLAGNLHMCGIHHHAVERRDRASLTLALLNGGDEFFPMSNLLLGRSKHLIDDSNVGGMDEKHAIIAEISGPFSFDPQSREVLNIPPSTFTERIRDVSGARIEQHFGYVIKGFVTLIRPSESDRTRYIAILAGETAQMCHPLGG